MFIKVFFASLVAFTCFATSTHGATLIPNEVKTLQEIAKTLEKTDWNFTVDPCSGELGWVTPNPVEESENSVKCNCTFLNNTICHVVSIVLKAQSLPGTVPKELVKLPYLQEIDLTRNYLYGSIPAEWGSTKLVNISLLGNRLTGSIPKELGNISTLVNLTVEFNQLSGVLPPELGNLSSIEKMHLTSNKFTGELPETFAKLTTLKDLDVSFNKLSGKIPDSYLGISKIDYMYLTENLLTGRIPDWILQKGENIDLSYNNFTSANSEDCQTRSVNLFGSSSGSNNSGIVSCLRGFPCPKNYYSVHINCGGREVIVDNRTYEDDTYLSGASTYHKSETNWAVSSTGYFMDDSITTDSYIANNKSILLMNNSALYMNARLSALSLTYYAFCLGYENFSTQMHGILWSTIKRKDDQDSFHPMR